MSETWYGRSPSDAPGEELYQPPNPDRTGGYRHAPRHTGSAQHRTGSHPSTGEWRTAADRRPPRKPATNRTRRPDASPWHWLLFVPIVLPLMPGLYNRMEPTLFGLPFFFWSQLGFAFVASAVIAVVHLKAR